MVEVRSPAVSEDRGHMSKVDGPESLAISIRDVSCKLMNLKIILLLIHCLVDMPTSQARLSYLVMAERYRTVRVMVSEDRWATLHVCTTSHIQFAVCHMIASPYEYSLVKWLSVWKVTVFCVLVHIAAWCNDCICIGSSAGWQSLLFIPMKPVGILHFTPHISLRCTWNGVTSFKNSSSITSWHKLQWQHLWSHMLVCTFVFLTVLF